MRLRCDQRDPSFTTDVQQCSLRPRANNLSNPLFGFARAHMAARKRNREPGSDCMVKASSRHKVRRTITMGSACSGMGICSLATKLLMLRNPALRIRHLFACDSSAYSQRLIKQQFHVEQFYPDVCGPDFQGLGWAIDCSGGYVLALRNPKHSSGFGGSIGC